MSRRKILVVEDEALIVEELALILDRLEYEVVGSAASGREAIAKAAATSPDIVLMDVTLQGTMDGLEAARRIRMIHNIPIVYLTAHAATLAQDFRHSDEPYSCVAKPFAPRQLRRAIEDALAIDQETIRNRPDAH